jgi:hypothetical protein
MKPNTIVVARMTTYVNDKVVAVNEPRFVGVTDLDELRKYIAHELKMSYNNMACYKTKGGMICRSESTNLQIKVEFFAEVEVVERISITIVHTEVLVINTL